ncbi:hypothetical protein HY624_00855 [Candidatus Uhrbacteria bacterium]|nr:hypothetical protein [Candidatus Uhrbacteria bacterium]
MPEQTFGQSTERGAPAQPAESLDIRTMPEAFFPKTPVGAPLPWGIFAVVGVLVLALLGVGAYVLFFWEEQPRPADVAPIQNTNEPPLVDTNTPPPVDTSGDAPVIPPGEPPTDISTPPPTSIPISGSLFPQFGIRTEDTDHDNLTNEEEKALNTDPTAADTDRDGYADGQEIENLYDPLAPSPALLPQSRSVATYVSQKFGFRFLHPGVWSQPRPTDAGELETMITTPITGEFMEVIVQENVKQQSAFDWYVAQMPAGSDPKRLSITSIENLEGVWSLDGKTVYFTLVPAFGGSRNWIYGITYNTGEAREVNYPMIFRMMIESFRVQPPVAP